MLGLDRVRGDGRERAYGDGGRTIGHEPVTPARLNHENETRDPQQRQRRTPFRCGGPCVGFASTKTPTFSE